MDALLKVRDVARLLGLHPNSIYRLVKAGDLVPTWVGGALRFAPRDVQAFAERSRVVPPTPLARKTERPALSEVPLPPGMTLDTVNPISGRTVREDIQRLGIGR